ncbi:MAG: HlyD family efflux transporter periplasmic adaptor subunit [Bacteroidales bacterium]|nr:HlyD family efflux transporter periplasmic adaptor subunit [Bacteroidales bacterium]
MDRPIEKKRWTAKKIISIVAIASFAYLLIHLFFLRDRQSRLNVFEDQLTIVPVKLDKFQEFIPIDGVVFPKNTIYIDAVQGGVVEIIYVEDGAILNKGDSILKLMNANMEIRYMEQETRILDAINNLQNSKINLERNKFYRQQEILDLEYRIDKVKKDFRRKEDLFDEKLISEVEFEDAGRELELTVKKLQISIKLKKLDSTASVSQVKQINVSILRMEENLSLLGANLENLYIKAPAFGKLSSFGVEIGETKSSGEHLGQIDMLDGFKLRANIDERYISRVYNGQDAEIDFGGENYRLFINKIYTDVTAGSFQVDLYFKDDYPTNIKRGQTIQIRLEFSRPTEALIIKRGGFFQETGGNWIYIVDPSGEFATRRSIRLGSQNTYYYEVIEGLKPGEKVIVSSYDSFGNKDKLVFK